MTDSPSPYLPGYRLDQMPDEEQIHVVYMGKVNAFNLSLVKQSSGSQQSSTSKRERSWIGITYLS